MIEVNNHIINEDVENIIIELRRQLEINGIKRFNKIVPSGQNIQTNCPFHKDGQERKPSFGISKKDGACHCFGCGWSGCIEDMISSCFGKEDFGQFGTKWLIQNFLSISIENRQPLELNFDRGKTVQQHKYIEEAVLDTYRYTHPYMYERKMTDEVIEIFDIGYDKDTNCITFPNRDINGNCLFVARRSVSTKFFNYPVDVDKPVYGLYEYMNYGWEELVSSTQLKNWNDVIICESMIDSITCWVYGKFAIALNGLGTESQFETLRRMPNRKFIIATDMDNAGLNARKRIKKALNSKKIVTEYKWDLSVAKDINDMSREYFNSLVEVFN